MTSTKNQTKGVSFQGLNYYPWESQLKRFLTPFQEFVEKQTAGGILLFLAGTTALLMVNSPLQGTYEKIVRLPIIIQIGPWNNHFSLLHLVNEGLMAFFFFVVGLEIKREILVGELADIRKAVLPIVAAMGGMLVPACCYYLFNTSGYYARGWGIPMATDIAFCVSAMALLGKRIPEGLMIFLVSLAIVDDIGAVLVIAVFYTTSLNFAALGGAVFFLFLLMLMNLGGVRNGLPYLIIGVSIWLLLLTSGVHATLAGIIVAFSIPAHALYDQDVFLNRMKSFLAHFESLNIPKQNILDNSSQQTILNNVKESVFLTESPLQRMQDLLHLPVAILIVPAFALVNTGIPLGLNELKLSVTHPVTLSVMLGLLVGKPLGICLFVFSALKTGLVALPNAVRPAHIVGVGLLGGIGFTMSIFISELSFGSDVQILRMAKTGILLASCLAGLGGFMWLRWLAAHENGVYS